VEHDGAHADAFRTWREALENLELLVTVRLDMLTGDILVQTFDAEVSSQAIMHLQPEIVFAVDEVEAADLRKELAALQPFKNLPASLMVLGWLRSYARSSGAFTAVWLRPLLFHMDDDKEVWSMWLNLFKDRKPCASI